MVRGRSCTTSFKCGNSFASAMDTWPVPPPTSTTVASFGTSFQSNPAPVASAPASYAARARAPTLREVALGDERLRALHRDAEPAQLSRLLGALHPRPEVVARAQREVERRLGRAFRRRSRRVRERLGEVRPGLVERVQPGLDKREHPVRPVVPLRWTARVSLACTEGTTRHTLGAQVGYVLPGVQHGGEPVVGEDVGRDLLEDVLRCQQAQHTRCAAGSECGVHIPPRWGAPIFEGATAVPATMSRTCAPCLVCQPRPHIRAERARRAFGPAARNTSAAFTAAAVRMAEDVWYCNRVSNARFALEVRRAHARCTPSP